MSENREFDVVIFGASGFTGAYVIRELARVAPEEDGQVLWAIAGRNQSKLESAAQEQLKDVDGVDAKSVATIIADVNDPASLLAMCKRTRVVINCVGPFRYWGEPVVQACVDAATHYVDITGEPQFIETMAYKFHDDARAKNLTIVPACGFDCIPAELGCYFSMSQFKAPAVCNSVQSFLSVLGPRVRGHYGTYQSAVEGFGAAYRGDLSRLRKKARAKHPHLPMETVGTKLKLRGGFHWSKFVQQWCMPFMGADASVVKTTQWHRNDAGLPCVQFGAYATLYNFWTVVQFSFYGTIFNTLARWSWGRSLLLAFPRLFTGGVFSHEGPTAEDLRQTSFVMEFHSHGYKDGKPADKTVAPDTHIVTRVSGPEPGYVATPTCVVQAALSIVTAGNDGLPRGVLTPGYAFGLNDKYLTRLIKHGIKFEVVNQ